MNAAWIVTIELAGVFVDVRRYRSREVVAIEAIEQVGLDPLTVPINVAGRDQFLILFRFPRVADNASEKPKGAWLENCCWKSASEDVQ